MDLWLKKITVTQLQYINVQQILVVVIEFTSAVRGFMNIIFAARGVKKVEQHCSKASLKRIRDAGILENVMKMIVQWKWVLTSYPGYI